MNFDNAAATRFPVDQGAVGPQRSLVDGNTSPARASAQPAPIPPAPGLEYALLSILADGVEELEAARIALGNRIWALRNVKGGKDSPEEARMMAMHELLQAMLKDATKDLERAVYATPVGPWIRETKGLGAKTMGRLLGMTGDPATRDNPAQLWAFLGLHVIDGAAPRRRKGEKANWSSKAKSRAWNLIPPIVKCTGSPYGQLYRQYKADHAADVHDRQCQNTKRPVNGKPPTAPNGCGTQAHPEWGAPGSPLRPGHLDARAYRYVMKRIIRDLWREARTQTKDLAASTVASSAPAPVAIDEAVAS